VNHLFKPILASLVFCFGGNVSMSDIMRIAEPIAEMRQIRIDRMARRTKSGMICWLCENAPELSVGLVPAYLRQSTPPPMPPAPTPPPLPAPAVAFFRMSDTEMTADEDAEYWAPES
jgi:hypothetical protein